MGMLIVFQDISNSSIKALQGAELMLYEMCHFLSTLYEWTNERITIKWTEKLPYASEYAGGIHEISLEIMLIGSFMMITKKFDFYSVHKVQQQPYKETALPWWSCFQRIRTIFKHCGF
ncbi:hypothetical protein DPMN_131964 [Dreissena polymorpha]|uniref:Uncharacterized protein n=1 Tax=Dreissena polymorpha TaxID=45954 RepID=A0A9D4FSF3_DREPO|nr:hypothetical protein DPMN_131964 [Dreissena polymorpha]